MILNFFFNERLSNRLIYFRQPLGEHTGYRVKMNNRVSFTTIIIIIMSLPSMLRNNNYIRLPNSEINSR